MVANCDMNRERQLAGVNSYARELGFDPLEVITARLGGTSGPAAARTSWLDLCCGTGRALIQAAARLEQSGLGHRAVLVGVDLGGVFDAAPPAVHLVCASVHSWTPAAVFDLITCVHGLHYAGDKLGLLARAASWLSDDGRLAAHLDLASIRLADGRPAGRRLISSLRAAGFGYDSRRHQVTRTGRGLVRLPYRYLGADDRAGANYTGQPAVDSYYEDHRTRILSRQTGSAGSPRSAGHSTVLQTGADDPCPPR